MWQEYIAFFFKKKSDPLTTLLFADGQVILTASQDSVQKFLHKLSNFTSTCNLITFKTKTKLLTINGKYIIMIIILINNNTDEQVRNFS